MRNPNIVVIGGGTGSHALLKGLKKHTSRLSALVSMADDGGSTGRLRNEFGVLPPGDVRQCLVALSESEELGRLFSYRYQEGTLAGHTFGNLFLTALAHTTGDFAHAVATASEVLKIRGQVIPMTLDDVQLVVRWHGHGRVINGQRRIEDTPFDARHGRPQLALEPLARINPAAREAIGSAALIIIAPGDLYTSLGAALVVDGVREALAQSTAPLVYVCNLMTKRGQTTGFSVQDHASEIERLAGRKLDVVVCNVAEPPQEVFAPYANVGESLVLPDVHSRSLHCQMLCDNLLAEEIARPQPGDQLARIRSLIRHDPDRTAEALMRLVPTVGPAQP